MYQFNCIRSEDDYKYLVFEDKDEYSRYLEDVKYHKDVKDWFCGEYKYNHDTMIPGTYTTLYIIGYRDLMKATIEGEVSEKNPLQVNIIDEHPDAVMREMGHAFIEPYMSSFQGKKVRIEITELK